MIIIGIGQTWISEAGAGQWAWIISFDTKPTPPSQFSGGWTNILREQELIILYQPYSFGMRTRIRPVSNSKYSGNNVQWLGKHHNQIAYMQELDQQPCFNVRSMPSTYKKKLQETNIRAWTMLVMEYYTWFST